MFVMPPSAVESERGSTMESEKVVAIIRHSDEDGNLHFVDSGAQVVSGEHVTLFPSDYGHIAVVGDLFPADNRALEELIERLPSLIGNTQITNSPKPPL